MLKETFRRALKPGSVVDNAPFEQAIRAERPDLAGAVFVEPAKAGECAHILMTDREAFKTPVRYSLRPIDEEVEVLKTLASSADRLAALGITVPKVTHESAEYGFFGMTIIDGQRMSDADFMALPEDKLDAAARKLAAFKVAVAEILPPAANDRGSIAKQQARFSSSSFHAFLEANDLQVFEQEMADYLARCAQRDKQFAAHTDLNTGNFLLDDAYDICGVLDFANVETGFPEMEFIQMQLYLPSFFVDRIVEAYAALSPGGFQPGDIVCGKHAWKSWMGPSPLDKWLTKVEQNGPSSPACDGTANAIRGAQWEMINARQRHLSARAP